MARSLSHTKAIPVVGRLLMIISAAAAAGRVQRGTPPTAGFVPALTAFDQVVGEPARRPLPQTDERMQFREALDDDEPAWQALLAATPSGDFLQAWAWGSVAAYDGEPPRRFLLDEDGEVVAIVAVQRRIIYGNRSMWYAPHGPVLDYAHPRADERLAVLADGLRRAAREAGAIAVRLEPRIERGGPAAQQFERIGLRPVPHTAQVGQTQLVDIGPDESVVFAASDAATRRKVRRAARDGVRVEVVTDPGATDAVDRLARLVRATEARSGVAGRGTDRIGIAWRVFAARGSAAIVEAWIGDRIMASGMVVVVGDRSFYLFSGSLREAPSQPKAFPSYAMQWRMIRVARELGARTHDLWGIEPLGAGSAHPWHGIGTFKRSFGGRSVAWAGSWDVVVRPQLYRLRTAVTTAREWRGRVQRAA